MLLVHILSHMQQKPELWIVTSFKPTKYHLPHYFKYLWSYSSSPALFEVCWPLEQTPGHTVQFSPVFIAVRGLPWSFTEASSLTDVYIFSLSAKRSVWLSFSITLWQFTHLLLNKESPMEIDSFTSQTWRMCHRSCWLHTVKMPMRFAPFSNLLWIPRKSPLHGWLAEYLMVIWMQLRQYPPFLATHVEASCKYYMCSVTPFVYTIRISGHGVSFLKHSTYGFVNSKVRKTLLF